MFSVDIIDPRMCGRGPYLDDRCRPYLDDRCPHESKTKKMKTTIYTKERYMHKSELQTICLLPSTTTYNTTITSTTTSPTTTTSTTTGRRQHLSSTFIKDNVLNNAKHRHKLLLWDQLFDTQHRMAAGEAQAAEVVPSTCRLVFIHKKTTNESVKYCKTLKTSLDGWDVLVARSWTGTIWSSLLFSGAVAVGCEEMNFVRTTRAIPVFPNDYPDTPAGTVHSTVHSTVLD
jgi:hypothetical protein